MLAPPEKENAAPLTQGGDPIAKHTEAPATYTAKSSGKKPVAGRSSRQKRVLEPPTEAWVYAGLRMLGHLEPTSGQWAATSADGEVLGNFNSRRQAAQAVIGGAAA
jgi:hypothetical protein